jgi:type I restriction enzyme R subunit
MIGRGTRLSTDVFGPGMDKQGFLIFDYYDNFRYFDARGTWSDTSETGKSFNITPQSILLNQRKLSILRQLQQDSALCAFDTAYRDVLRDSFISEVQSLQNDDVDVQYHIAIVNKYRTAELWDNLTEQRRQEITEHIIPLLPPDSSPVKAKNFDLLMYVIQDEYKQRESSGKDVRKIKSGFHNVFSLLTKLMNALLKLKTIPDVMRREQLIVSMIDGNYLMDDFSLERAESVRKELRGLMSYIPDEKEFYVVDFADMLITGEDTEQFTKEKPYQEKVKKYLDTSMNPALAKLRNLDELTSAEKAELDNAFTVKLGTAADFAAWAGSHKLLPFLRIQAGIDDAAIQNKFGSFLNSSVLNGAQHNYMNQIIGYARENGDITFMTLQNTSPFCDVDIMDLFGDKVVYIRKLVDGLHKPVM